MIHFTTGSAGAVGASYLVLMPMRTLSQQEVWTLMVTDPCKAMENAISIVSLRLSDDEWSRVQGDRMLSHITTEQLLALVATQAIELRASVEAATNGGSE